MSTADNLCITVLRKKATQQKLTIKVYKKSKQEKKTVAMKIKQHIQSSDRHGGNLLLDKGLLGM